MHRKPVAVSRAALTPIAEVYQQAPPKVAVLLSGTGRTLLNLLNRIDEGSLRAKIVCVISDRKTAPGLEHAVAYGVPCHVAPPKNTWELLADATPDLVCLAGYLRLLPIPKEAASRVLNIHPSLLPAHGGPGYYGSKVHASVLAAGDAESGCTVHLCDQVYDRGEILVQHRVPVLPDDTVDTLSDRVFDAECVAYPEAIKLWVDRFAAVASDRHA